MLLKLAFRNVLRQRVRTTITLAAIMFGVVGLVLSGGFVKDIFVQLGEAIIQSETGHIQVTRTGFADKGSRQPERYLIEEPSRLVETLSADPSVRAAFARLSFSGMLNNGRRDLPIVGEGIEPDKEAQLGTFLKVLEGRPLEAEDMFQAIIGEGVAHVLGLKTGDQVTLLMNTTDGALNTIDLEIVGVFQSFSRDYDARAVRLPLAAARELMATTGANRIIVTLDETDHTDRALERIAVSLPDGSLEARSWKQLSDFYDKTLQLYQRQFDVLKVIILLMVVLSVSNTVSMSTFERLGEFGTLQALGNTRYSVFRLIMTENALIGLIGASLGVITGILIALAISAIGIPMPPPPSANTGYTATIRLDAPSISTAFLIGFSATVLAAVYPAIRVARTKLVEALGQRV